MKQLYIATLVTFLCAFSFSVCAQQSPIDTCNGAQELIIPGTAPHEDCANYTGNMANEFLDIHPCPDGLNNVWYRFEAIGPTACVNVSNSGQTPVVWLAHYINGDCIFDNPGDADYSLCSTGETNLFQDLVVGQTYYVSVAFTDDNVTNFDLCVHNPPAPVNDEACTAVKLSDELSENGTVNGATNSNNTRINCQAAGVPYGVVWYQYEMPSDHEKLTIDLSGLDPDIEYGVSLHPSDGDCSNVGTIIAGECIMGDDMVDFEGLTPGETYWIRISAEMMGGCSEGTEWGDFIIEVDSEPRIPCDDNENCANAEDIPDLAVNEGEECVEGCTGDMEVFTFGNGDCFDHPNGGTWYSFTTDASPSNLDIDFTSSDVLNPIVSVLTTNDCTNFNQIVCTAGANGVASLNNVGLNPNTTYFIVVSDDLDLEGDFDLCLELSRQELNCTTSQEIEVTSRVDASGNPATPLEGPYCPGDQVTFCYRVLGWDQNVGCQWLQGIIPTFGDCWDIGADEEPDGGGVTPLFGATWEWYGEGEIDYNLSNSKYLLSRNCRNRLGLCEASDPDCTGDPLVGSGSWQGPGNPGLPGGWYAWDCGGNGGGCGDPDEDYGDGAGCTGVQGPWEVCFTLTAMDFMECLDGLCGTDCSVSVWTTADQETGIWEGGSVCTDDDMAIFNAQLNCTDLPEIDAQPQTICSGEQLSIAISSNFDPDVEYTWDGRVISGSVSGAGSGGGPLINDILFNSGTMLGQVEYTIVARIAGGCQSDTTVVVDVLPQPIAEAGEDNNVCFGFCNDVLTEGYQLGGTDFNPDWTYSWTGGSTLSDPDIYNPLACPQRTTTYTLTVTDEQGCTSSDQVTLFFLEKMDIELTGPDTICAFESTVLTLTANVLDGGSPAFQYNFSLNGLEDGFTSRNFRNYRSNDLFPGVQTFAVQVRDSKGCEGFIEKEIVILAAPEPRLVLPSDTICVGGSTVASIEIVNFFDINDPVVTWTTPSGIVIPAINQIVVDESGTYLYQVTDGGNCPVVDSFTITALPPLEVMVDTLRNCDLGDGTSIFDLNSANVTNEPGTQIVWHITDNLDSLIGDPSSYITASDTVFAVVFKGACNSPFVPVWLQVDTLPDVTISGFDPFYCVQDDPIQLIGDPAGGFFAGDGVDPSGIFDPALVGRATAQVRYMVTDGNGCLGEDSISIDVVTPNGAMVSGINEACITGDTITLSATPVGGTYSGSGIVDAAAGKFLPSSAGVGRHVISYEVQDTCLEVGSMEINVVDTLELPIVSCGYSATDSLVFNWSHGSATDFIVRVWRGGQEYFNGTTSQTSFSLGGLVHDVTVNISVIAVGPAPCGNSSVVVSSCTTEPCPVIMVEISADTLHCVNDPITVLTPSLAGGQFSGNGMVNDQGTFDPAAAGIGRHRIEYRYLRQDSCLYSAETHITVEGLVSPPDVFCSGVSLDSVAIGWTHPDIAEFIINVWYNGAQVVTDQMTLETLYEQGGLQENDSVRVEVIAVSDGACGNSLPATTTCIALSCDDNPPSLTPQDALCVTDGSVDLQANPSGGLWSGPGITDNQAGTFTPSTAGAGVATVAYVYVDDIGCPQRETMDVSVIDTLALPVVNCIDGGTDFVEIGWSHISATQFIIRYTINGGAQTELNTADTDIRIDGRNEGDIIRFTVIAVGDQPCGNSSPVTVECIAQDCPPSPINVSGNRELFCVVDALYGLTAVPNGGIWISTSLGLVDNQFFDPSLAGFGPHTMVYTWNDGANCTYSDSIIIQVEVPLDPPTGLSCTDQQLDQVRFEWDAIPGATYVIYYTTNRGERVGPITTTDNFYVVAGLTEFDDVVIELSILGQEPCGDSESIQSNCIALNCDIVISNLAEILRTCDSAAFDLEPIITGGDGNYTVNWTLPDQASIDVTNLQVNAPGVYKIEVEDGQGCKAEAEVEYKQDVLLPLIEIGDPSCFGFDDGRIEVLDIAGTNPPYEVSFNGRAYSARRLFTGLSAESFTISVRDALGCTWDAQLNLADPDFIDFGLEEEEFVINWGDDFVYRVEVDSIVDNQVIYKIWSSPDTSIQDPTSWTLESRPLFSTFYAINVETDAGCEDGGQLRTLVKHDRSVYIPNVFYPGSFDPENQGWKIYPGPEVAQINSVRVFNRWGGQVYTAGPYGPAAAPSTFWDGQVNGQEESPQVYVYVVTVTYLDGLVSQFEGDLTLLR